jgi:ABC-type antimicrobial peptide transport system permease subunit
VGKEVRLGAVNLKVVGVLSKKGANTWGRDQDDVIICPWTTIKYRVSNRTSSVSSAGGSSASSGGISTAVNTLNNLYPSTGVELYPQPSQVQQADTPQPIRFANINNIMAGAATAGDIPAAINQITQVLRERHHLREGQPDDFHIIDMTEINDAMMQSTLLIGRLLLIVAMISLIVGGVGIMNIMLVSVTERTREIGLRMAVGAQGGNILLQFLVEATVLCLMGGTLGILLGRGASLLVRALLHWPTAVSMPAIIVSVIVSAIVGVVFGFYPAWKASKLDPIEALRYE